MLLVQIERERILDHLSWGKTTNSANYLVYVQLIIPPGRKDMWEESGLVFFSLQLWKDTTNMILANPEIYITGMFTHHTKWMQCQSCISLCWNRFGSRVIGKHALWSLSLSYQKKDLGAGPVNPSFWHHTKYRIWSVKAAVYNFIVGVIPKEGLAILLWV